MAAAVRGMRVYGPGVRRRVAVGTGGRRGESGQSLQGQADQEQQTENAAQCVHGWSLGDPVNRCNPDLNDRAGAPMFPPVRGDLAGAVVYGW